jgi:conjugal transfer pilus assembly protein TraV
MITKVKITLLLSALSLQACSLFPYEDKFGCNRGDNLGKCVSAQEAYEEMTTGESSAPYMKPYSEQNNDEKDKPGSSPDAVNTSPTTSNGLSGYDQYLDANYNEVANLLDKPVTPIIKPVKTAELLVLPYSNTEKVLKGERYINVILEEPSFILGDYLKKQPVQMKSLFNEL